MSEQGSSTKLDKLVKYGPWPVSLLALMVSGWSAVFSTYIIPTRDAQEKGTDHKPQTHMWFGDSTCHFENTDSHDIKKVALFRNTYLVDVQTDGYIAGGGLEPSKKETLGFHEEVTTSLSEGASYYCDRMTKKINSGLMPCEARGDCAIVAVCEGVFHRNGDLKEFTRPIFAIAEPTNECRLRETHPISYRAENFDESKDLHAISVVMKGLAQKDAFDAYVKRLELDATY